MVSTPHVGGPGQNTHANIKRSELGLIEIRSHTWRDVVWININGNAPEFKEAMADAIERWCQFEQPLFHGSTDSRFNLEVNCNWKFAEENFCESYHLPWVHPGLNSYPRLEDHYNIEHPGAYSGQGTFVYRQLKDDSGGVFPDFANLSSKWENAAEYLAIYANVLVGTHRDHAFAIILVPKGPEKTLENVHLQYPVADTNPQLRAMNTTQQKLVFEEDVFVVEGMQRGRHGVAFDGGKFSPAMDSPTYCFHDWAGQHIEAKRGARYAAK